MGGIIPYINQISRVLVAAQVALRIFLESSRFSDSGNAELLPSPVANISKTTSNDVSNWEN